MTDKAKIDPAVYRDKVYGCWQGKSVGGTLGMPYEGVPWTQSLEFYEYVPSQPVPNDDLELQLIWLWYGEKFGAKLSAGHLIDAWDKHIRGGPDEYGVAVWNIRRGLKPPMTGVHNNYFTCGMGSAIRSEIWACLFPGRPELAAHYACEDACVDHDGDGVWAEAYLAAAESMAFVNDDPKEVLKAGLAHIPEDCRIAEAMRFVIALYENNVPLEDVREKIMGSFGSHNFTDCVMNLSFLAAGVLYGEGDFDKTVLTAVNCGMDTDCTGATTGAFMGILYGSDAIPEKWKAPLGDSIVVNELFRELPLPKTLDELTDRTIALAERFAVETESDGVPPSTFVGVEKEKLSDNNRWAVFNYAPDIEMFATPDEVAKCEADTTKFADRVVAFDTINMDLDPHLPHPGSHIYMVTKVSVEQDLEGFLMVCADTGVTATLDGRCVLSYYGRLKRIPAFHRTEGGGAIPVSLKAGREYVLKIRLLACHKPMGLTVALSDENFNYVKALYNA